jgi:hypothetical protein
VEVLKFNIGLLSTCRRTNGNKVYRKAFSPVRPLIPRKEPLKHFSTGPALVRRHMLATGRQGNEDYSPNCGNPPPLGSSPVRLYSASLSRVSVMSRVRIVNCPMRSCGEKLDSPFSIVKRSGW